jgi:hypothetical protein
VAHLGLGLVGRRGRWKARRGSSAMPGVGHHGGGKFRRGQGEVGQRAVGEASTGSQGGAGWLDDDRMKGKAPFTEQHPWCRRRGTKQWGGPACRGRSSGSLLTRHACLLATAGPTATRLGVGAGLGRNAHCSRRRGLLGALGARGASGNAGHGRLGGPARARPRSDAARRGAVRLEMCWCANV